MYPINFKCLFPFFLMEGDKEVLYFHEMKTFVSNHVWYTLQENKCVFRLQVIDQIIPIRSGWDIHLSMFGLIFEFWNVCFNHVKIQKLLKNMISLMNCCYNLPGLWKSWHQKGQPQVLLCYNNSDAHHYKDTDSESCEFVNLLGWHNQANMGGTTSQPIYRHLPQYQQYTQAYFSNIILSQNKY